MAEEQHTSSDRVTFWVKIIERVGIPFVVLVFVLWGLSAATSWTGEEVVKPMTQAYIATLGTVQDSLKQQSRTMEQFANTLDKIEQTESEMHKSSLERHLLLERILQEQTKTTFAIDTLRGVK